MELHIRVAVEGEGGSVTLPGVIAPQERPAGRGASDSDTLPLKPLTPVTVMIEVPEDPTNICETELAATVKSVMWNVIAEVVCASGSGLVPLTVTL